MNSPDRLTIAEGLDVVFVGDNEALVQYGSRSRPAELLRDSDLTGVLRRLLGPLRDSAVSVEELLRPFQDHERPEAEDLLRELVARGIVASAAKSSVEQYLGFLFESHRSLSTSRVVVLGAGPLGARLAYSLGQHGVGQIALLDERPADELWYAFLPAARHGSVKIGAMAHEALQDFLLSAGNTGVEVLPGGFTPASISSAVANADLVVLATEQPNPGLAHLVNRACLLSNRPWMLASIDGNIGLSGPLFIPPDTACYNDYEVLSRSTSANPHMDRVYHRFLLGRGAGSFFPGLPAYADIVAGFATLSAVHFLVSGTSEAIARLTSIDFQEMQVDIQDVLRLPRCPVCNRRMVPPQPAFPPSARPDLDD